MLISRPIWLNGFNRIYYNCGLDRSPLQPPALTFFTLHLCTCPEISELTTTGIQPDNIFATPGSSRRGPPGKLKERHPEIIVMTTCRIIVSSFYFAVFLRLTKLLRCPLVAEATSYLMSKHFLEALI